MLFSNLATKFENFYFFIDFFAKKHQKSMIFDDKKSLIFDVFQLKIR